MTLSLFHLGIIADQEGDHAGARGYFERSLEIVREIGQRMGESRVLNRLGVITISQGDYARARGYYEHAMAIARQIGDRLGESWMLSNLGEAARYLGDYVGAQGYYEQSLVIARQIGDRQGEGIVLGNLGHVAARRGDYAKACDYYEGALTIFREIGALLTEAWALTGWGDVLVMQGNSTEAVVILQQAVAMFRDLGNQALLMESLATLARAYLTPEDTTQALAQVKEILIYLDEGGRFEGAEQPLRNTLTCYQVLHAGGDPRAARVLQIAYETLQEQASRIPDEPTRCYFLENVPWHRDILAAYRGEEVSAPRSSHHGDNG